MVRVHATFGKDIDYITKIRSWFVCLKDNASESAIEGVAVAKVRIQEDGHVPRIVPSRHCGESWSKT